MVTTAKPEELTQESNSCHAVVNSVPRGGGSGILGTPIQPRLLVTTFVGFYALNGIIGMIAPPEVSGDTFPDLKNVGSPEYVAYQHVGPISLSYALLVYLTVFRGSDDALSSSSVASAVAYSSLPLAYFKGIHLLKGIMTKFGTSKLQTGLVFAFLVACAGQIVMKDTGNATLVAKMLASFPLIIGVIGELNPDYGIKLCGFPPLNNAGKAFFIWFAALAAGYGVLSHLLLQGVEPIQAVGYAAALELFFMIDCVYIRKWNVGVAPPASNYVFMAFPLLTAVGVLLLS